MAVHRLANGPITLTIASITEVEGKFGTQYCFSDGDTEVYLNAAPAARQLGRLKLDVNSAIGQTLAFSQVVKDGTTYSNIDRANAGAVANARHAGAPQAGARPAPAPQRMLPEEAAALYTQCVAHAIVALGAQLDEAGIPQTAEAIQSAAATMFIACKGRA
jgi:hypothetical protein